MTGYVITEARICHLRNLLLNIRPGDLRELQAAGKRPRHALFGFWRDSIVRQVSRVGFNSHSDLA